MKIVAKMDKYTCLVEMSEKEWANLQGVTYTGDMKIPFDPGSEIDIVEEWTMIKQIKNKFVGQELEAIINGAQKIINLSTKMKSYQDK